MKRILLLILFNVSLCQVFAQTKSVDETSYTIYSNSGVITLQQGREKIQLKNGMKLQPTSLVTIPAGGRLVIVNEETRERFTISESGSNSVAKLILGGKKKSLAQAEFNYLKKQLLSSNNAMDRYTTVDRKTNLDSLVCDTTKVK